MCSAKSKVCQGFAIQLAPGGKTFRERVIFSGISICVAFILPELHLPPSWACACSGELSQPYRLGSVPGEIGKGLDLPTSFSDSSRGLDLPVLFSDFDKGLNLSALFSSSRKGLDLPVAVQFSDPGKGLDLPVSSSMVHFHPSLPFPHSLHWLTLLLFALPHLFLLAASSPGPFVLLLLQP